MSYARLQGASEANVHAKEHVYELCGRFLRDNAGGVEQVVYIGVVDPLNPTVESAEHIANTLCTAAKYIPRERLGACDDCGFAPFLTETKPNSADVDAARTIAFKKIKARVDGVRLASQRLELGRVDGLPPRGECGASYY